MSVIRLTDARDDRVRLYRGVTDAELLRAHGLFVAEGRLVVRRLLTASPFETRSVLVTEAALVTLADVLHARRDVPVFVVPQEAMNDLAGFHIHRGCLALGVRPAPQAVDERLPDAARYRVLGLERIGNPDNVGGLFRCAAAFGVRLVVLAPGCCDPLYRKAIRTSIGATLHVPFVADAPWPESLDRLRANGCRIAALTPSPAARDLGDAATDLSSEPRLALLLGSEFDGLSADALARADHRLRIPIDPAIDSLNVAVAAGIGLYLGGR